MRERCQGKLALTETAIIFECPQGRVSAPFNSIIRMEYRSKISRQVRRMKFHWTLKPPSGGKHNRLFTVVYRADGRLHAMVLKVPPNAMRPYLAELDLRVGHRVDVERYY